MIHTKEVSQHYFKFEQLHMYIRDGHGAGSEFGIMVWCMLNVRKSMAEMGTEPDPDSKSNIWRLTDFGAGFLVFRAGSGVNFSDSAHFRCTLYKIYLGV